MNVANGLKIESTQIIWQCLCWMTVSFGLGSIILIHKKNNESQNSEPSLLDRVDLMWREEEVMEGKIASLELYAWCWQSVTPTCMSYFSKTCIWEMKVGSHAFRDCGFESGSGCIMTCLETWPSAACVDQMSWPGKGVKTAGKCTRPSFYLGRFL